MDDKDSKKPVPAPVEEAIARPALKRTASVTVPMVTEVRIVNTAYGPAKISETSKKQDVLIARRLAQGVRLVPYVERGVICGIYYVDSEHAKTLDSKTDRYPVLDTIPFFLMEDDDRQEVAGQLKEAGIVLATPEEFDLTGQVKKELEKASVIWRNRQDNPFELDEFVQLVAKVKASSQFKDIYLIKMRKGCSYIMAVDQLIEAVIDLHPHFLKLYQPDAVRIAFRDNKNTWLAPLRSARAKITA